MSLEPAKCIFLQLKAILPDQMPSILRTFIFQMYNKRMYTFIHLFVLFYIQQFSIAKSFFFVLNTCPRSLVHIATQYLKTDRTPWIYSMISLSFLPFSSLLLLSLNTYVCIHLSVIALNPVLFFVLLIKASRPNIKISSVQYIYF